LALRSRRGLPKATPRAHTPIVLTHHCPSAVLMTEINPDSAQQAAEAFAAWGSDPAVAGSFRATTSDGSGGRASWTVTVPRPENGLVRRQVRYEPENGNSIAWRTENEDEVIWPTWTSQAGPQGGTDADTALDRVHDYWSQSADRIRDSAKWLAAILGLTVGALVGTSPLSEIRTKPPQLPAILFGVFGLLCLTGTMWLILKVLRPTWTSFEDLQQANEADRRSPLGRWKHTVESQQDLYLPSGIATLTGLRQEMIVNEISLTALARAIYAARSASDDISLLQEAQAAQVRRLEELRAAASRISSIGEFYELRQFSSTASTVGGLLAVAGTACIIFGFAWPPA